VDDFSVTPETRAGDPFAHAGDDDLYRAACSAMRLLQDRQAHIPEEMLDPRERKVLRQLRAAVGRTS
jgi:hypothetical protein